MVSAKQGDNSVAMAIQSLVRHVLETQNIPRKWKPLDKPVIERKPADIQYDKMKPTGIEKVSMAEMQPVIGLDTSGYQVNIFLISP